MQNFSCLWNEQQDLLTLKKNIPSDYCSLLIQVFWGKESRQEIPTLQQQLTATFPNAEIIGTTTAGGIYQGTIQENTVIISLTIFDKTAIKTTLITENDESKIAIQITNDLSTSKTGTPALLLCYLDGFLNGDRFVKRLNSVLPTVPVAGGLAGDDLRFESTAIFNADKIIKKGAVVVALYGDINVHQQFNFNWKAIGPKFTVTKSTNNIIAEIDNIPILEFYKKYLGTQIVEEHLLDIAMEFPFIFEKNGIQIARTSHKLLDDGSLLFAGNIEQGQQVQFGIGSIQQVLEDSISQTIAFSKQQYEIIFVYSCVARKILLNNAIEQETLPLNDLSPANGFFTYGELVHYNGKSAFLNQTLTYVALSEKDITRTTPSKIPSHETSKDYSEYFKDIILQSVINLTTKLTIELEETTKRFKDMAEHDQLTGLFNRHAGARILKEEMSRSKRHNESFSIALLDLDFFKKVNDTYGHDKGDEVLVYWANFLQGNLRPYDRVVRWGGEEILVILPNTKLKDALQIMTKLRSQFTASHQFDFNSSITFSGGVAQWFENLNKTELLKNADNMLYQAKEKGRNLICASCGET